MATARPRLLLLLVGLVAVLAGCSTARTLTLESVPTGADVWVNGEYQGKTPVGIPFVYYGWFEVRLEKKGYEALATQVEVPAQIDGYPIVDLPFELTVKQRNFVWKGTMQPIPKADEASLRGFLEEAEAFRERTLREAVADPPPTAAEEAAARREAETRPPRPPPWPGSAPRAPPPAAGQPAALPPPPPPPRAP